jgi:drug/metabolite transporter (DMT)-like permease
MTIGMAAVAAVDALVKIVSSSIQAPHIVSFVGFGGLFMFWAAARVTGQKLITPVAVSRAVMMRNVGEFLGAFGLVLALGQVPLSLVTTVMQSVPLFVTFGAALLLGERVDWRTWIAIVAGFAGMLIILRPGLNDFDVSVLFALLAAIGLATRDLASRVVAGRASSLQLSAWGCAFLGVSGLVLSGLTNQLNFSPDLLTLVALVAMIILTGGGMLCITAAMRVGQVGTISPFRYTRLIFGLFLGTTIFGEALDMFALLGGAIIVFSGIYTLKLQLRA